MHKKKPRNAKNRQQNRTNTQYIYAKTPLALYTNTNNDRTQNSTKRKPKEQCYDTIGYPIRQRKQGESAKSTTSRNIQDTLRATFTWTAGRESTRLQRQLQLQLQRQLQRQQQLLNGDMHDVFTYSTKHTHGYTTQRNAREHR